MRPLTPEEITRLQAMANQHRRHGWIGVFLVGSIAALVVTVPLVLEFGWNSVILLVGVFAFAYRSSYFWVSYLERKRRLEAALAAGVAEQKTGKVYDRFRTPIPFVRKRYTIFAEEGIALDVDRSGFEAIQMGDTISVDRLPQTGQILAYRKVARS